MSNIFPRIKGTYDLDTSRYRRTILDGARGPSSTLQNSTPESEPLTKQSGLAGNPTPRSSRWIKR